MGIKSTVAKTQSRYPMLLENKERQIIILATGRGADGIVGFVVANNAENKRIPIGHYSDHWEEHGLMISDMSVVLEND